MPKFKTDEAKEEYHRKMEALSQWRIDVQTDIVLDVIPTKEQDGIPWKAICRKAVQHYKEHKEDIQAGDSMFETHKDTFVDAAKMYERRGAIRRNAMQRGRGAICNAQDGNGRIIGVCLSRRKKLIERTYQHRHAVIQGSTECVNIEAEIINKKTGAQIGTLTVQLLLPSTAQVPDGGR